MRIGLVSPTFPASRREAVEKIKSFIEKANQSGCKLICFPEAYLPGMRGQGIDVEPHDQQEQELALQEICQSAKEYGVAVIVGMEWETSLGLHNAAFVVDANGEILGYQVKNQLHISEDGTWVPDGKRKVFEIEGLTFGIAICHEGWRYPETVRFAAVRGAQIVFQPQYTASLDSGRMLTTWGDPSAPYYERTMVARAVENTIFYASVNYAMPYQDSATSLISPDGECLAYVPYGKEDLLVYDLDLSTANRLCANRYNPSYYQEEK